MVDPALVFFDRGNGQERNPAATDVDVAEWLNANKMVWVDGHLELSLAALAAIKQYDIDVAYESAMQALLSGYTESQRLTFDKQDAEARAYLADPSTPTPFLDSAAPARGVSKEVLAGKIVAKADAFAAGAGALTGKWQGLRDAINDALSSGSKDVLISIVW